MVNNIVDLLFSYGLQRIAIEIYDLVVNFLASLLIARNFAEVIFEITYLGEVYEDRVLVVTLQRFRNFTFTTREWFMKDFMAIHFRYFNPLFYRANLSWKAIFLGRVI